MSGTVARRRIAAAVRVPFALLVHASRLVAFAPAPAERRRGFSSSLRREMPEAKEEALGDPGTAEVLFSRTRGVRCRLRRGGERRVTTVTHGIQGPAEYDPYGCEYSYQVWSPDPGGD